MSENVITMPKIDLSLTITAIIALVSLFSPIITSLINNHYELKKRTLEIACDEKRKALNIFISCTLNYYGSILTYDQMCAYTSSMNNLYLYFHSIDSKWFIQLDKLREDKNIEEYKSTLNTIVIKLSKQIGYI